MLKHLSIRNYALIESLEPDFYEGFSVMTGETGAGKSIILGALSLILGQRADLQSLKNKSEKCVVEGIFNTTRMDQKDFFSRHNLDYDPETTILRREILPSGKSRAFINDTPVSLAQLKELAASLVDLHSQNSATLLQSTDFQLGVIDSFCNNHALLAEYKKLYSDYRAIIARLEKLRQTEAQAAAEQDYFRFQFEELEKARLSEGEKEEIEEELEVLEHAGEIKSRLLNVMQLIESEHGLNETFSSIISEFKPLKDYSSGLAEIFDRIESSYLEMSDIANELSGIDDKVDVNPERTGELNERLNLIYQLEQKHRVTGIDELNRVKNEYHEKINRFESLGDEIKTTEKQAGKLKAALTDLDAKLSERRTKAKPSLENKITETVTQLGMPEARIELKMEKKNDLTATGTDSITFLFNANKGGELQDMSKIASGGELSRLMLAIKSQIAANNLISTIIFDEIDSGVSGEVAGKMAGIMQKLGDEIQVISITHLPQIAARGKFHYLVIKDTDDKTTKTSVKILSQEERITEIAKMLSDTRVSTSAIQTAEELMKN